MKHVKLIAIILVLVLLFSMVSAAAGTGSFFSPAGSRPAEPPPRWPGSPDPSEPSEQKICLLSPRLRRGDFFC